jgi:hypothetical protein
MIAAGHRWFVENAARQWSFLGLCTSHRPMFSAPERFAVLLANLPGTVDRKSADGLDNRIGHTV